MQKSYEYLHSRTLNLSNRDFYRLSVFDRFMDRSWTREQWSELKNRKNYFVIQASFNSTLVGLVLAYNAPGQSFEHLVHVLKCAVHPDHRRQGVGEQLISLARQQGGLFLEVDESNAGAIAFYRRLGLLPIGLRKHFYTNGGTAVIMQDQQPVNSSQ